MKKKQVAALVMASVMTLGMTMGQVAFAQGSESAVVETSQDVDNATEKEQKETSEDTQESKETEEKTETKGKDTQDESAVQSDKKDAESNVAVQSDGVSTQADDPVVDSSAKTVTYNNPIDITVNNDSVDRGYVFGLSNAKAPSSAGCTFIYNEPVHITFDGVTADTATIVPTNRSGFHAYQFNAGVTVDIKNNSNIQQLSPLAMFGRVSSIWGGEKELGMYMNEKLTVNIENSTVGAVAGGMVKNGEFSGSGVPPVKIDSNCKMDGGVDINISGKSNVSAVYAGHIFTSNDTKESNNQTFTMKTVNITADDSTIGGIVSSRLQTASASDRANDAKIDGDLNITLKNGAKLTSSLIANKCNYGKNDAYQSGEVTGKTTLTTDSAQKMAQLRNVDELNLGGAVAVVPASADTGARMTVKDTGMKLNLTNPDQWNTGDTVLSYKYTDGIYPKVEENKVSSNWSDASVSLVYGDDTAAATQEWTLKKSTADISIKEKDGSTDYGTITVKKNDKISWDQIPEMVKKQGYEISGWEKEDGSTWDLDNDVVTENMALHPVWKLKHPEATLNTEGNVTVVHAGQGLKLTAAATHDGPENIVCNFVWYKDGKEIKDVAAANEAAVQAADGTSSIIVREAGEYSVKVTATDGKQTSDEVACGPIAITVSDHSFDKAWEKNETDHWHVCTVNGCGVKEGEAAHTFGEWTVTKAATATEAGSKEAVCTVCGYKKTEVIPAMGESKDPTKDDQNKDQNKPGDNSGNQNNGNQNSGNHTTVQVKKTVKTGDTNGIGLALAGMVMAAGAGVSAGVIRKRR